MNHLIVQEDQSVRDRVRRMLQAEDPLPKADQIPVLFDRGSLLTDGKECLLGWNSITINMGYDIKTAFGRAYKFFDVFGVSCQSADKQFFKFFFRLSFSKWRP